MKLHRRFRVAAVLLGVCAVGGIIYRLSAPKSLLDKATSRIPLSAMNYEEYQWDAYFWVSETKILHRKDNYDRSHWFLFDTRTRKNSPANALNRLVHGWSYDEELSPDGKSLLWQDAVPINHGVYLTRLDGSRQIKWPSFGRPMWTRDSRHWVRFYATHPEAGMEADAFKIYDTEAPKSVRAFSLNENMKAFAPALVLHSGAGAWSVSIPSQRRIVAVREQEMIGSVETIQANFENATVSTAERRISLSQILHCASGYYIRLSNLELSPNADKFAFSAPSERGSEWLAALRRWIPFLPAPRLTKTEEVWVSSLDGRSIREIGHIASDSSDGPQIHDLRWLPNGKSISFIYQGSLYTVPVE